MTSVGPEAGSQPFEVSISHHGDTVLMSVTGELDLVTAPQLTESVDAVLSRDPAAVVIDLSNVAFLASSGMTVLVKTHERVAGKAKFGVVADGPNTGRPLALVGLDGVFTVYTTVPAALDGIESATAGENSN